VATFCSACGQPLAPGAKFCSGCRASTTSLPETLPSATPGKQPSLRCKTCEVGLLRLEKKYLMRWGIIPGSCTHEWGSS
jgi:hypothetical protein